MKPDEHLSLTLAIITFLEQLAPDSNPLDTIAYLAERIHESLTETSEPTGTENTTGGVETGSETSGATTSTDS